MSMREAMMAAAKATYSAGKATVGFALRTGMQAAERIIPHGANELAAAINTGNAYAPPGVTERLTPPRTQAITPPTAPAQAASGPVIAPPRPVQAQSTSISPPATPRPAYTPPQVQSTVHGNTQTRGRSM